MARKPRKKGAAGRVLKWLALDIALIGVALCVFALFHHVLPSVGVIVIDPFVQSELDPDFAQTLGSLDLNAATQTQPTAAPEQTPAGQTQPTAAPEQTPAGQTPPTAAPEQTPAGQTQPTAAPQPISAEHTTPETTLQPSGTPETAVQLESEQTPAPSAQPTYRPRPVVPPTSQPTPTPTPAPTPVPTYAPGDFSALFDRVVPFAGEIRVDKDAYLSEDISIRISTNETSGVVFHVADIYIRHIENFQTAFANDIYGKGQREYAWDISMQNEAVLSVNGDYYGARENGVVIRNGVLYRDDLYQDVCVLYKDGVMETYSAEQFDCASSVERGAWQAWSFGPMLLDEKGKAMEKFNSVVVNRNPRCGIGYYEPGHYCFVVVEGRNDRSRGVTLAEFSLIFEQLGCTAAYNMDGGNTAVMTYGSRLVSEPSQGGRPVTDIIMIAEVDAE